jgi:DNA-binding MarR family transcriptional regulator
MAASCLEAQSNRQMNQMSGGHEPDFTPTQGQYLAFIDAYTRVNLRPPAEADIQRRFGVTPPSVHQMILALERAGLIRRQPGMPRSVEVLVPPEQLPVLETPSQPVKTSVPRY